MIPFLRRGRSRDRIGWLASARATGEALLAVYGAELRLVGEAWQRSAKRLGIALGIAIVGLSALFWAFGAMMIASIEMLATRFGRPGAGFIVACALTAVALLALAIGVLILRRTETPAAVVRERLGDHLQWWHDEIAAAEETGDVGRGPSGARREPDDE